MVILRTVITGDIKKSRKADSAKWMPFLEEVLEGNTLAFDIFRGDSFQAVLAVEDTFSVYYLLKAKLIAAYGLDIRIGIGVGELKYEGINVSRSNGTAFVRSGAAFDALDKNDVLISTPWPEYDEMANIMLDLSSEISERWTPNMAETVVSVLEHPGVTQQELAKILGRKHQSQVSTELNRAAYSKIEKVIAYCTNELVKRC